MPTIPINATANSMQPEMRNIPHAPCDSWSPGSSGGSALLSSGALLEPVEILIQAGAEFFGQRWARIAGSLGDAAIFPDLLVVDTAAEQGEGRIVNLPGPT